MSDTSAYGVDPQRKAHSSIKSGKKELSGNVEGSLGPVNERIDGQRQFLGLGATTTRSAPRLKASSRSLNRAGVGSFRVRKRSVKG